MDMTISERLTAVETKQVGIHDMIVELKDAIEKTDGRVQTACDYILAEKAKKSLANSTLVYLGGFIAAVGTMWEIFKK